MLTQKSPKVANKQNLKYKCIKCHYYCSKKSDFEKHLLTAKHHRLTNTNKNSPKIAKAFLCSCGKEYKHASSLTKHKKTCSFIETQEELEENIQQIEKKYEEDNVDYKELLITAMKEMTEMRKENTEMRKQMTDMIPLIGNNNNSNNTNNFNLQFFLNNDCKDALNLTDFINSLQVQLKDLEYTAENGHIKGITNIFHTALSNMEQTKRPLHCTDLKREVLYIKDNNEWLIDEDKEKIKNAVNIVENKNIGNQAKWLDAHPNLEDEKEMEKYIQMQDHSLGTGEESEKNKIVKNILKEVTIQK